MKIKYILLLPLILFFAYSSYAVTSKAATSSDAGNNTQTAPTFCKTNTKLRGQEICFCLHGNCKLTAPDTKTSKTGHYMLCVDSTCEVAHDSWIDCKRSTCTIGGDNATIDCINNSKCSTTKGISNASIICRPIDNSCVVANKADVVYCRPGMKCNYSPQNHKNVKDTEALIPFNYFQEYLTSGEFQSWLDQQVGDYESSHSN